MSELDRRMISRKEFVGLGLSAALLSSGASPFVAKAKTVNFMAATTARLSKYCLGDGSDETDTINGVLEDHLFVEIDEPPAGKGYGFRANGPGGGGLLLRSGHEINGRGANAKLLRVGKWQSQGKCFRNRDATNGNSSIKLNNIYIEGYRYKRNVPDLDSDASSVAVSIRAFDPDKWCRDIQLTRVRIHDWPGISIRVMNGSGVVYKSVESLNPSRGGIIFNTSRNIQLLRVRSANSGDDAMAFYVTSKPDGTRNRPIYGITMDRCESYTRKQPQYGAALKLAGAREARITNSVFRNAKNALVSLVTYPGGFHPKDIRISDCKMLGGAQHSFEIKAKEARLISVRRNYMHSPGRNCVNVSTWDGRAATFDVTVTDNTLSDPGSGRHIKVQKNIRGVYTKGNRLV